MPEAIRFLCSFSSNDSVAFSSGEISGFIRKRSDADIENLFDRISSTSEALVRDIKIGRGFVLHVFLSICLA